MTEIEFAKLGIRMPIRPHAIYARDSWAMIYYAYRLSKATCIGTNHLSIVIDQIRSKLLFEYSTIYISMEWRTEFCWQACNVSRYRCFWFVFISFTLSLCALFSIIISTRITWNNHIEQFKLFDDVKTFFLKYIYVLKYFGCFFE